MSRQSFHPLIWLILSLAALGFIYELYTDPLELLTQFLIFGGIAAGLFFLYKKFLANKLGAQMPHRHTTIFSKNTRTNNLVQHKRNDAAKKKPAPRRLQKRKNEPNLTVIEGRKSKKKKRALF